MEETREEGTEVFLIPPKKGTRGGIEAGKMQLTRIKSRERSRDFNFVLDGEAVNRCKNIGKGWQGRVLRQKLEKRPKQLIRRWLTQTRWHRNSFLKNLSSISKEDLVEDRQQGKKKRRQVKFYSHTPRFEGGFRGGQRHRASRPPSPTRTRFWKKNIKAAKEGDKEKTEQVDRDDRPG